MEAIQWQATGSHRYLRSPVAIFTVFTPVDSTRPTASSWEMSFQRRSVAKWVVADWSVCQGLKPFGAKEKMTVRFVASWKEFTYFSLLGPSPKEKRQREMPYCLDVIGSPQTGSKQPRKLRVVIGIFPSLQMHFWLASNMMSATKGLG